MTNKREIRDRVDLCAAGCQTDLCAGGRSGCGSCCACRERCQVARVEEQLSHPLLRDAAAERIYAIDIHRKDRQHDDRHTDGELRRAAAAYALASGRSVDAAVRCWPWRSDQDQLVGFKPATWENRRRDLVKAMQFLMAEWDRLERDRLMTEAMHHPVLPPRALCDGDQEIWYAGSGWWIQVFERENPADGWRARVYVDGPDPIVGAGNGVSQRSAAFEALQDAEVPDAERLARHWPDTAPSRRSAGQVEIVVDPVEFVGDDGRESVKVATVLVDGAPKAVGRGATEEQATAQALLNAGIGFRQDGGPVAVGRVPEWVQNLPAPDPQQAMSRGWHPDQAVVDPAMEVSVKRVTLTTEGVWSAIVCTVAGTVSAEQLERREALVSALELAGLVNAEELADAWLAANPVDAGRHAKAQDPQGTRPRRDLGDDPDGDIEGYDGPLGRPGGYCQDRRPNDPPHLPGTEPECPTCGRPVHRVQSFWPEGQQTP